MPRGVYDRTKAKTKDQAKKRKIRNRKMRRRRRAANKTEAADMGVGQLLREVGRPPKGIMKARRSIDMLIASLDEAGAKSLLRRLLFS